jgi:hypothetical protein
MPALVGTPPPTYLGTPESEAAATEVPAVPETLITFRVEVPPNTPAEGLVYLSLLDEVTGLALNTQINAMEPLPPTEEGAPQAYLLTLPFRIGSVLTYRYERQVGDIRVAEHLSDGSPVRYRMYYVQGQGLVEDVISRWTDTGFESPSGRIMGTAIDADTGSPIPNLLVTAGGAQTLTAADGSFVLEVVPPGTHNLVGYALDGSYQTFQQGARVAEKSTTPAELKLQPASSSVTVIRPERHRRWSPCAWQAICTGNTSPTSAGDNSLAANMPGGAIPDNHTLTIVTHRRRHPL